jgi:hypothetical protein
MFQLGFAGQAKWFHCYQFATGGEFFRVRQIKRAAK